MTITGTILPEISTKTPLIPSKWNFKHDTGSYHMGSVLIKLYIYIYNFDLTVWYHISVKNLWENDIEVKPNHLKHTFLYLNRSKARYMPRLISFIFADSSCEPRKESEN